MRGRTLLVLAGLVGVFAIYIVLVENRLPSTDERRASASRVLDLAADEITALHIERDGARLVIERTTRRDDALTSPVWHATEPFAGRADVERAKALVAGLVGLENERTLENTTLAAAGLESPRARIEVRTVEGTIPLLVGPRIPGTDSLLLSANQRVHQVPSSVLDALGMSSRDRGGTEVERSAGDWVDEWRDRRLFHDRRDAIERIVLTSNTGQTVLTRVAARWRFEAQLDSPIEDRADADAVARLLTTLTDLRAIDFLDDDGLESDRLPRDDVDEDKTVFGTVSVTIAGRTEPFVIEVGPPRTASHRATVNGYAVVVESPLPALLTTVAEAWRDPRWSRSQVFAIAQARFADDAGVTTLVREDGSWHRDGDMIDFAIVSELLYAVTAIESRDFVSRSEAVIGPRSKSPESLLDITLRDEHGDAERLAIHRLDDRRLAAVSAGRDTVLLLAPDRAEDMLGHLRSVRESVAQSPTEAEM